jgi:hypothetical protein
LQQLFSLVVYIPDEALDRVRLAIAEAGGGVVGHYDHVAFVTRGTGFFRPLEGSSPHLGEVGTVVELSEYRLEVLVGEEKLDDVLRAMRAAHPYEEIAYSLVPTLNHRHRHLVGRKDP